MIKTFKLCQDHNLNISQVSQEEPILKTPILSSTDQNEIYQINWNEHIPYETFEAKTNHLDLEKKLRIQNYIDKFSSIFAKHQFDVGTVTKHEAHIQLIENRYVAKKPYRCSYKDPEEIEKQITELLKHGMIEQSCSPFASPVTLAYKKVDESGNKEKTRMCVDFRELNRLLVPEAQPFPLIEDIITKTRDCEWFSTFDINSAFWSITHCKTRSSQNGVCDSTRALAVGEFTIRVEECTGHIPKNIIGNH